MSKIPLLLTFLFLTLPMLAQDWKYDPEFRCILNSVADNVLLRSAPGLNNKKIKKLMKGHKLIWTNKKSKQKDLVSWNGKMVSDFWYKVYFGFKNNTDNGVHYSKDSVGWVFGKALKLESINFNNLEDSSLISLNNDWVRVEWVSQNQYTKLPFYSTKWVEGKNKEVLRNGENFPAPFTLRFQNGKSKTWKNDIDDIVECTVFTGDFPELGFYIITDIGADCGYIRAYRKSDGKVFGFTMPLFSTSSKKSKILQPIMAPDHKTMLSINTCEPDGMHDTFWQKMDNEINFVLRIRQFIPDDFRFETPTSGIAKLKHFENGDWTKKSHNKYLRISLK